VVWQCTVRRPGQPRCPAMVTERDGDFQRGVTTHNHTPTVGLLKAVRLKATVRQTAAGDLFATGSAIVKAALRDVPLAGPADNRPTIDNLVQSL
jgi:hypothetical protein